VTGATARSAIAWYVPANANNNTPGHRPMRTLIFALLAAFAIASSVVSTSAPAAACESVDWRGECNPWGE
jgi:hypothetical protein